MRAAVALPILVVPARAGAAEVSEIGFTLLGYRERGLMKVVEPVLWGRARIGEFWEVQGSVAVDIVSGASPEGVSNISGRPVQTVTGASVTDRRHLGDVKVSRRMDDLTVAVSRAFSEENDYRSHAYGLEARLDLDNRNTTLAVGYGHSGDRIGSTIDPTLDEGRDTREYLAGVTQVLSAVAVVQSTLTFSRGRGWYNDPYKFTLTFYNDGPPVFKPDTRPASRDSLAWLTRYRRHFTGAGATLQADYRFYRDDWGVRAHTIEVAWQQWFGQTWALRPALRYHTQSAARFYAGLIPRPAPAELSSDPRLAAFGGLSPSLRAIARFESVVLEATVGHVHNSRGFRAGGNASPSYATLAAWYGILSWSRAF